MRPAARLRPVRLRSMPPPASPLLARPLLALPLLALPLLASLLGAAPGAVLAQDKQPSTFSSVIGSALLCRSQLDNAYFHDYLKTFFGAPYRHEGGAWWFRTGEATLWGVPVSEVLVGDGSGERMFVAAVAEAPPDQLEQSIATATGLRHLAADASNYPLRVSNPGSTIAYYNTKSKIYCAKFKPPAPSRIP